MALNVLKVFSPQTLDAVLAGPGLSNRLFVFTGIAEIEFSAPGNNKLVHDVVELVLSDWHGDIHLDLENTELTTAVWPASMHADDDATQVTWAVDDAFAFVTEEDRPKLRVIVAVQGDKGVLSRIGYEVFARTTSIPIKSFDVREVLRPVPELVISLVLSQNAVGKGEDIYLTSLVQLAREEGDFFLFRIRSTERAARRRPPSSGRSRGRAFFTTLRHVRPSSADSLTCDPRAVAAGSRPAARIRPAWCRTRRTPPQAPFRVSPRAHARTAR